MRKAFILGSTLAALLLAGGCAPRRAIYTSPPPVYVPPPPVYVPGTGSRGYVSPGTGSFRPRDSSGRTRGGFSTPSGTGSYQLNPQGRSRGFSRPPADSSTGRSGFSRPSSGGSFGAPSDRSSFSRPSSSSGGSFSRPAPSSGGSSSGSSSSGGGRRGFSGR